MSNAKSKITATRRVNVFAELSHGNGVLLENAKERRPGYHYETLASVIMAAFKFEAFLNHIGFLVLPFWSAIERVPHKNKLEILATHLNVEIDSGKRPFQTLTALFQARDGMDCIKYVKATLGCRLREATDIVINSKAWIGQKDDFLQQQADFFQEFLADNAEKIESIQMTITPESTDLTAHMERDH
jgi:hypothetical protein